MSTTHKKTANVLQSLISFVNTKIATEFSGVTVLSSFAEVYDQTLPVICVRLGNTTYEKAEIGGDSLIREINAFIDIFATDDINAMNMKDLLISNLKDGFVYNEYVTSGNTFVSTTANGRVRVLDLEDYSISFDSDSRNELDIHDRYRWIIILKMSLGRIE